MYGLRAVVRHRQRRREPCGGQGGRAILFRPGGEHAGWCPLVEPASCKARIGPVQLNPRIPDQLERLATDIRVDHLGDPHLAFVVLLYPDQHGTVLCVGLADRPPVDMAQLSFGKPGGRPRPENATALVEAELDEARHTLDDLLTALRVARPGKGGTLTEQIQRRMAAARNGRLVHALRRYLEGADRKGQALTRCEFCGQPFTDEVVKRHEGACRKNPAVRSQRSGGVEPILGDDGRIIGYRSRQRPEPSS